MRGWGATSLVVWLYPLLRLSICGGRAGKGEGQEDHEPRGPHTTSSAETSLRKLRLAAVRSPRKRSPPGSEPRRPLPLGLSRHRKGPCESNGLLLPVRP